MVSQHVEVPLKCTHINSASSIGNKHGELRHLCDLASQRHDGMACKVPCYSVGILALKERQRIREGRLSIVSENS